MSAKPSLLVKYECTPGCNAGIRMNISLMKLPEGIDKVRDDFHCTLLFANEWTLEPVMIAGDETHAKATRFEQFGSAIVLILDNSQNVMKGYHELAASLAGAKHSYEEYVPYTTLFYASNKQFSREELDALFEQWPNEAVLSFDKIRVKQFD